MLRYLLLPVFLMFSVPLWGQDAKQPETAAEESAPAETDEAAEDSVDESVEEDDILDELYSEDEEDKFIPSEDVAFGQSLVFPTDI